MSALPDSRLPAQPAATSSQETELSALLAVAAMCCLSLGILTGTACMEWRPACTAGLTAQGAGYRQLTAGISKRSSLHKGTAPLLFKGPAGTATHTGRNTLQETCKAGHPQHLRPPVARTSGQSSLVVPRVMVIPTSWLTRPHGCPDLVVIPTSWCPDLMVVLTSWCPDLMVVLTSWCPDLMVVLSSWLS